MMDITDLQNHCYVPYSNTDSLAVVRSKEGTYFPGCRIESIAYPLSISAIQNALFSCLSEGSTPDIAWTTATELPHKKFWESELEITCKEWSNDEPGDIEFADLILDPNINLKDKLVSLLDDAVVKESDFPVAALLKTDQGIFSGVNIECSAWDMGLCAERVAIAKALTYGSKQLEELYIHTRSGDFSSPCGACRQVIIEHMPDRQIHLYHADHSTSVHFSTDLLPHSFQSSSLKNN
ncbi:cytidine deaminase, homotetrameric [Fodinibius salinus]|uniref:Cytidine deaminase, homotetrameric n=1 Tax=Fodinibius salinus TaxID=860790 RepID=A0A5D3YLX9_9BACT|nr:cytidine deaminase [Fodinibius salinus]TYP94900.1 cytidine deaminase, homotetrameric [Fodinibius salinus]